MHHICVICLSPFLYDSDSIETEAIVTACGHVFHRDCIKLRRYLEGATCCVCSADLKEGNKFKKIFLTYDEEDYDRNLLKEVQTATAADTAALKEQAKLSDLEWKLQSLREEHLFNQSHISRLDLHVTAAHSLTDIYEKRIKRLREVSDELKAQCDRAEEQLQDKTGQQVCIFHELRLL
ncbi:hypothetical protein BV20DRAFT_953025 [Pilatotrama ljubarskyi]|nr:hypothetical protein BV20DRAFT_953025 [Pilatotrama ljubarskyi]